MDGFRNLGSFRNMDLSINKNDNTFKLLDFIENNKNIKLEMKDGIDYLMSLDVYDSIHIEGNTLTRADITAMLEGLITIREKPLKEYFEANNYNIALDVIKNNLSNDKLNISEDFIKTIHRYVTSSILHYEECGQYRKVPVSIRTTAYIPPMPEYVENMVYGLCDSFNQEYEEFDGFTYIIRFFYKFEGIHPFVDGNGRTGRLLMNYLLLKNGYNFLWVDSSRRIEYLKSFETFQNCLEFHVKQYFRSLIQVRSLKVCPLCKGIIKVDKCLNNECSFNEIIM